MSHSSYYSQAAHQNITENRANTEDDHHRVYEPPLDQCECQKELFNDHSADLDIWVFCVHYIYLTMLYGFLAINGGSTDTLTHQPCSKRRERHMGRCQGEISLNK